jgi:hypothetical protein
MKTILLPIAVRPMRISGSLVLLIAGTFLHQNAMANPVTVNLGSASSFGVLAGSGITVGGAANSTTINGNIGTYPTTTITGLGNVVLNGVNHAGDSFTQNAKNDLSTAFSAAAGQSATTSYTPGSDLGGLTLTAGVYADPTSFGLTGTLTLDAQGNPNAVFIIQAGSSLTTGSGSSVILINGAQANNVFWVVGSSATLGMNANFTGTILASTSITADTGAVIDGSLLAENGTVALDDNSVTVPTEEVVPSVPDVYATLPLLGFALVSLSVLPRRWRPGKTDVSPGVDANGRKS